MAPSQNPHAVTGNQVDDSKWSARNRMTLGLMGVLSMVVFGVGWALWPAQLPLSRVFPEYVAATTATVALWFWAFSGRDGATRRSSEKNLFRDVRTLGQFFLTLIGFGFYLLLRVGWSTVQDRYRLLFVILLWGLSFLSLGGLLGFLFGIPRTLTGSLNDRSAEAKRAGGATYQVNTNLERVSDWLTTIIVGGTVTQLAKFPEYWAGVGDSFAASVDVRPSGVWRMTGSSSCLFFLVVGFLASYLLTRMYLAGAMQRADGLGETLVSRISSLTNEELQILEAAPLYYGAENPPFSEQAKKVAQKVLELPLEDLGSWRDIRVWAKAQLAEGKWREAGDAYARALEMVPNDAELRLGYAIVLGQSAAQKSLVLGQLELARDSVMPASHPDLRKNVFKSLTYAQLFLKRPESFQKVLESSREYFTQKSSPLSAGILFNVACAYGQAHRWLADDGARILTATELTYRLDEPVVLAQASASPSDVANLALAVLKLAIERDERYRAKLRAMIAPRTSEDDDFRSLADDPRIIALAAPTAGGG